MSTLNNYKTGEVIREATLEEIEASKNAGEHGLIEVDGTTCYVEE